MKIFLILVLLCDVVVITGAIGTKIVSGFTCHPRDYPYLIALRTINRNFYCGGSLVNKRHVLTAGHCCDYSLRHEQIRVYAGVSKKRDLIQASRVWKRFIHPMWDVCVLRLYSPIYETSHITFVKLATTEDFDKLMENNGCDECITMGFGTQNIIRFSQGEKTVSYNPHLQCVYQKVLRQCWDDVPILCVVGAHNSTQDACQGDSGGPLICNGIQVGIVSAGHGCGLGLPSYYVQVNKVYNYITAISAGNTYNFIYKLVLISLYLNILLNVSLCYNLQLH